MYLQQLIHYVVFSRPNAQFEEQYGLLAEHLRILAAISGAHPELQQQGQGQQGGAAGGSGGAALVDEE
jgi:DNA-binding FadR family transcriptional regulator